MSKFTKTKNYQDLRFDNGRQVIATRFKELAFY